MTELLNFPPSVSVVIPCWNGERWVAGAIESVFDQNYPRLDVVVVDDGSSDRSLEVIRSFGDQIRWVTGPNRGACAARNQGLEWGTVRTTSCSSMRTIISSRIRSGRGSALPAQQGPILCFGPFVYECGVARTPARAPRGPD